MWYLIKKLFGGTPNSLSRGERKRVVIREILNQCPMCSLKLSDLSIDAEGHRALHLAEGVDTNELVSLIDEAKQGVWGNASIRPLGSQDGWVLYVLHCPTNGHALGKVNSYCALSIDDKVEEWLPIKSDCASTLPESGWILL